MIAPSIVASKSQTPFDIVGGLSCFVVVYKECLIFPERGINFMEISGKFNGNSIEIQWKFNGNSMGIQWEFNGNSMGIQWEFQGSFREV